MSFDRIAPHYRWLEAILAGNVLQRARTAWLAATPPPRQALLAGEGHGRFLAAALAAWPDTRFLCLDASTVMLQTAARQVATKDRPRVSFLHTSLPDWHAPAPTFDLVVTHFFLDCFTSALLDPVIESLAAAATPRAAWLIADFTLPDAGPPRWRAAAIHTLMYAFFRRATRIPARHLTPPEPLLARHGFFSTHSTTFEWGLIRSGLWQRRPL